MSGPMASFPPMSWLRHSLGTHLVGHINRVAPLWTGLFGRTCRLDLYFSKIRGMPRSAHWDRVIPLSSSYCLQQIRFAIVLLKETVEYRVAPLGTGLFLCYNSIGLHTSYGWPPLAPTGRGRSTPEALVPAAFAPSSQMFLKHFAGSQIAMLALFTNITGWVAFG